MIPMSGSRSALRSTDRPRSMPGAARSRAGSHASSMPPTLPGYAPYCPFTVSPDPSGTWEARGRRPRARSSSTKPARPESGSSYTAPRAPATRRWPSTWSACSIGWASRPSCTSSIRGTTSARATSTRTTRRTWGWPAGGGHVGPDRRVRGSSAPSRARATRTHPTLVRHRATGATRRSTAWSRPHWRSMPAGNRAEANQTWQEVDRRVTDAAPVAAILNPADDDLRVVASRQLPAPPDLLDT